ncbi:hypothetical protein EVAR_44092_1 [Eumeta japonica]|uniref:Uncharacterized protein n=1 Tax=Eumeta variegata TaxID=151549 RepID=A0A4C1X4Z8_EUMVA|nr:hypothetical protein EVAR_44092_1 [Eumeta japonica]
MSNLLRWTVVKRLKDLPRGSGSPRSNCSTTGCVRAAAAGGTSYAFVEHNLIDKLRTELGLGSKAETEPGFRSGLKVEQRKGTLPKSIVGPMSGS